MLDLESLRIFVAAAETGNFTLAAKRLHISQPSVSQNIQLLEQYLDARLFERNGRRVHLSSAGSALLPLAEEVMRACQQIEDTIHSLNGAVAGHLTLGCSTSSGKYLIPRLLAQYRTRYPLVHATVKVGPREQVLDWLAAGVVDVAVTSHRVQRSGLHFRRFFEDEIVLAVPSDHPWAKRSDIAPDELYGERFVMRATSSGTHMTVMETLDQVGVRHDQLETVLTLDNSEAILMAVQEHIGVGFLPRLILDRHGNQRAQAVSIQNVAMKRWIYFVENSRNGYSQAAGAFWQFVQEQHPAAI